MGERLKYLAEHGYILVQKIFSDLEIKELIYLVEAADKSAMTFRKSKDLFAIRQFLKVIPEAKEIVFSKNLLRVIEVTFGKGYFLTKSIYFDKPEKSNWFVAWHQDLMISVDKRIDAPGFGPWTKKGDQASVQPPLQILKSNFTIRIHLDDTDESNGALKVIPGSHAKGLYRPETIDWKNEREAACCLKAGDIMIMRPLLMHSSSRSLSQKQRRVIHLEFSNQKLPSELNWAEFSNIS